MRLLSTRTSANDVAKHNNKGKRAIEVVRDMNKGKGGSKVQEQMQMRLIRTISRAKELFSTRTTPVEVVMHTNKGK
jgi:hypothetical protein